MSDERPDRTLARGTVERTSVPVPNVVGAVDDHDDLPTPFLVMDAADGTALGQRDVGALSDDALRRVARESGAFLADLHAVDVVDA